MKENIDISEFDNLFRQQLENASATPPAGVWEGISSSLSATSVTTAIAVKTAIWVKIGVGLIATAAIATVVYVATDKTGPVSSKVDMVSTTVQESKTMDEPVIVAPENETANPSISLEKEALKAENQKDKVVVVERQNIDNSPVESKNEPEKAVFKYDEPKQDQPITDKKVAEKSVVTKDAARPEVPAEPKKEVLKKKTDSTFINIPNVFSPDGDGINDGYQIEIRGEESVRIMIFDVNQNQIWETRNKNTPWNPVMDNGENYPEGTYTVKVIYKFPGSPEKIKIVNIKLVR